ncbi:serine/threonine protein kinase [Pseudocyphellaria aurata]|nr:serine/threonine protein kinase [Pseudocyphellaria aurata]
MDKFDDGDEENTAELEAELASMTAQERLAMLQCWKEETRRMELIRSRDPSPNSHSLRSLSPHAQYDLRDDHLKQFDDMTIASFPLNEPVKIEVTEHHSPLSFQEPRPISPERPGQTATSDLSQNGAQSMFAPKPVSGSIGKKILARFSKAAEPYEAKFLETTAPARERISRATSPAFEKLSAAASPSAKKLSQYTSSSVGKTMQTKQDFRDITRASFNKDYLCSQCKKFPFETCLPSADAVTENDGAGTVFRTSLRRVVWHRVGCRLCRFLLKAFCLPENDPFKHPQVYQHLEPRFSYESMKTWVDKVNESGIWYAYWYWPFGRDPDQGPSVRESWRYPFGNPNRASSGQEHFEEGSTHVLGSASRAVGKFAVAVSGLDYAGGARGIIDQQNVLPCYVEMEVQSYKDPLTCGLLHVKLLGHGRGPRAPLATLSSFRLRVATNFSHSIDLSLPHPPLRFGQIIEQQKINLSIGAMWLRECEQQHRTGCSEHGWSVVMQKPSFLRVIDVWDNCIVEVPEPKECRYVALSYVWGGAQQLQLQRYNKAELMSRNGLDLYRQAISQTILDAMTVVQGIDQRYLWVDCLCILQDDDDPEKLEQIKNMDQIYGSAILTIVAADATNANVGLEGVREGSRSVMQLAEELRQGFHIMAPTAVPQQLDKSPWNMRAWTMQERLLSRRLLIFTQGQVIWYCRGRVMFEDMTAEDKGGGAYAPLKWLALKPQYLGLNTRAGYVDGSIEVTRENITRLVRSGTFTEYARLVEEYSHRQITYSHDVLNALTGLLNIFKMCFKCSVRKGLPEILLDVAILWRPSEKLTSRASKELPSWSWAGWIGGVSYEEPFSMIVNIQGQLMRMRQENGQERIRPLLRWYSWNAKLWRFEAINKNGLGIPFGLNENEPLPSEWDKTPAGEAMPTCHAMDLPESTLILLDDRHLIFWTICSTAFRFGEDHWAVENSGHINKAPIRRNIFGNEGSNPVGIVLLDSQGPSRFDPQMHEFIVISEAQYYGVENEMAQQGEFIEYYLLNVMLIQWDLRKQIARRLGMGRIEKHQPGPPGVIVKFKSKIAAEEEAKKNKANADKIAAEFRRKSEIRELRALAIDEAAGFSHRVEQCYRSGLPSRGRNRIDVPELEARQVPQYPLSPVTLPLPVIYPAGLASRSELEAEEIHIQSDNSVISKLKDDLKDQQGHIQRLEADLGATKDEVKRLSTQRAEARSNHRRAIGNGQQDEIARLKRKVDALEQLLEEAGVNEDRLEGKVQEGRERALNTERELYAARRENLQIQHQLGVSKTASATSSPKECQCSSKSEPVASGPSSRRSSTTTKVEWAVSKRRGERFSLLSSRYIVKKYDLRIEGKYRLQRRIGGGGFGAVYIATSVETGEEVAIKLEHVKIDPSLLSYEEEYYKQLAGGAGIPHVYEFLYECEYRALVFDLLGPSLEDLFNFCGRKFSLKTVLMLADQLIRRLEFIHSKGLVHRDVKPDNFLMGTGRRGNVVYVTDLGLTTERRHAQVVFNPEAKEVRHIIGTERFASINGHLGILQSRSDDLQCLGYMFIYFLRGYLPWQGLKVRDGKEKEQLIMEKKQTTSTEELCADLPEEFRIYFDYIGSLDFDEKPSYSYLRKIFRNLFTREGFSHDHVFDWTILKFLIASKEEEAAKAQGKKRSSRAKKD